MKLNFSREQIESWKDKVHRRVPRLAVSTTRQALKFINDVGFCFAFKADHAELPCLWHATCGQREPVMPEHTHHDPRISFIWELKDRLPAEGKIYYGKLLKHRPTMVSLDFIADFYVLSGRTGIRDEYLREFGRGKLSALGKEIMDALRDSSPQTTRGLKLATSMHMRGDRQEFDRAMAELQEKMFVVKSAEEKQPFSFVWAPFSAYFPLQVRHARKLHVETARARVLAQYFRNQLVASVTSIRHLFGWSKPETYRALGALVQQGVVSPNARIENEPGHNYCLVQQGKSLN